MTTLAVSVIDPGMISLLRSRDIPERSTVRFTCVCVHADRFFGTNVTVIFAARTVDRIRCPTAYKVSRRNLPRFNYPGH